MNKEEQIGTLAALLEANCNDVRIEDNCMVFKGKKALYGILLLNTIYRDEEGEVLSLRIQWIGKDGFQDAEADIPIAPNHLMEHLQKAFPQILIENPARVKQCVRIALQIQQNHYRKLGISEGIFIKKPGWHTTRSGSLVYYAGPNRYAECERTVGMADSLKKYRIAERALDITAEQACTMITELARIPCRALHMAFLFQITALIKPLLERAGVVDRNPILYLYGQPGSGKTRILRLVNSLYLRNDGDREVFEIPLRSWKTSLYEGMQDASGTVVILDDLAGSKGVQSEQDAKKLRELIMTLGNGALPLRGAEGKESRVDFLAAVTANSILDCTLEILERICIVYVKQGDIPFERIQRITGCDPSPLAGVYLQIIRYIVRHQDRLINLIRDAKKQDARPNELYRMHGNYRTFRYAELIVVNFMRHNNALLTKISNFQESMGKSIRICEKTQMKAIQAIEERDREKRLKESYDEAVINRLRQSLELLAPSPEAYRKNTDYIGYFDHKNRRVCLKVKRLCRKYPPCDPSMPEGAQMRKACQLFKQSPWLIRDRDKTTIHGVDDARFLAIKAEALGIQYEP